MAPPTSPPDRRSRTPGDGAPHRVRYEFLVSGTLSDTARARFPELGVAVGPTGGTALYGVVEDAAHLHGLLDRFQSLGLTVIEMRQLPD